MKLMSKIFLFFSCSFLFSGEILNIAGKNLSFYFDSDRGSFYLENPYPKDSKSRYLLFKDNPPTSFITLYVDNTPYKLSEKDLKVEEIFNIQNNLIKGKLSYKYLTLTVYFILTNLNKGNFDDTLLNLIEIENSSTNTKNLEIRFLFDTVFGEEKRSPKIFTSGGEKIEYDRIYEEGAIPEAFFNGEVETLDMEFKEGLYIFPVINNYYPSKVIIGNWKKLSMMRNVFIPEPKARFRYNPYSNPDVAIFLSYKIKINPREKFYFGNALSRNYIPKEKLKFSFIEQTPKKESQSSETLISKGNEPEIQKTTNEQTIIKPAEANTNELLLLNAKLALYEKLNNLIDKIEKKFLTTNINEKKEEKKAIDINPPVVIITNYGGANPNPEQKELITKELKKLQELYEQRLKEVMDYYEKKLSEYEKDMTKKETPPSKKKDIDRKIKEIDKNLLLIEKLLKINPGKTDENKIKEIEQNLIEIEKNFP
ncbi:MAG: hypothetical protein N2258_05705 [Brevinematales bacterium]|nr:hypothetical protein [Brevinematales bacterium]